MDKADDDPYRGLSSDDICMYKKLYCWTPPSSVEETNTTEIGIKIFPNPTNNNAIILQLDNPIAKQINFEIISPLGNTVLKGSILPEENPKRIALEDISSGTYVIIFNYEGKQIAEKFIINK